MPTGYTDKVADGTVTDFREFAMRCAGAFGALVEMRDDGLDAEIPEAFEASDFYAKKLAEARDELARTEAMSSADVAAACESDNRAARAAYDRMAAEHAEKRNRYNAMLAKVVAWEPPSPDHQGLKDFMVQQLTESREWDCSDPEPFTPVSPADWRQNRLESLRWSVASYERLAREERERTEGRNRWLRLLRESLAAASP